MGPIILDIQGTELSEEDIELIQHPLVGGVIFFSRNYENPRQISSLCKAIRSIKKGPFLLSVDQEGGRVQRLRNEFVKLPSLGDIGNLYDKDKSKALACSKSAGWLMAMEVMSVGIDISFAPVLDLRNTTNPVVMDRSFHGDIDSLVLLAKAYISGMHEAGMPATGKHFPGHGYVNIDSHKDLPIDDRSKEEIIKKDLRVFQELIKNEIDMIMPAHIVFSKIDKKPAGFSKTWLEQILRSECGFSGFIISDDLNMEGAKAFGGAGERAKLALDAGCNMILICNNREDAIEMIDFLPESYISKNNQLLSLVNKSKLSHDDLIKSRLWQANYAIISQLFESTVNL